MSTPPTQALSHTAALILISGFLMLLPFSTDVYQPALPLLPGYFNTTVSTVQLTMSLYAASFAICQFILGPLSDRFGRLPVARYGIGIYFLGTLICMLSPGIEWLIGGRIMQGIGACSGQVCLRSMTRDLYPPQDAGHVIAKASMVMAIVPLVGPLSTGFLVSHFGWRATFILLSIFSGVFLVLVFCLMRETNRNLNPHGTRIAPLLAAYREVLRHPAFIAYGLCGVLSYGALFAFLSGSSFVFMRVLGVSASTFGICFSIIASGALVGSYVCRRLIPRFGLHGTITLGSSLFALSCSTMFGLVLAGIESIVAVVVPMWFFAMAQSINSPCWQAGAVAPFPEKAGSAAAMLGFLVMAGSSLVSWWIGISFNGSIMPLAATMGVISLLLLTSTLVLIPRYGKF